jgi:asparagine synthase (glutamine-hydrolysing)
MFYHVPDHYADIVHPLISQPIIELCLQIPCYVLTYGGIDRALVREAFEGVVPNDIVARTTKGGTAGYFNSLLLRNRTFLRDFLLGGLLVTEGLLDKRKTEVALSESSLIRDPQLLFPILDAVRAEVWLRTWIGAERKAAA